MGIFFACDAQLDAGCNKHTLSQLPIMTGVDWMTTDDILLVIHLKEETKRVPHTSKKHSTAVSIVTLRLIALAFSKALLYSTMYSVISPKLVAIRSLLS